MPPLWHSARQAALTDVNFAVVLTGRRRKARDDRKLMVFKAHGHTGDLIPSLWRRTEP
jgi:hypothetical protein